MQQYKYFNEIAFQNIIDLIESKNHFKALIRCKEYIKNYPDDTRALTTYATLLMELGQLDETERVLNNIKINSKTADETICQYIYTQIKLLCVLKKYKESYEMLIKYGSMLKEVIEGYRSLELFLKKKIGLPLPKKSEKYSYKISQIIEYNEKLAIEHIGKHMYQPNNNDSVFSIDFPLEDFFNKLRSILPLEDKKMSSGWSDLYIIKYIGSGYINGKSTDYIRVIVLQDTNDIITMYPAESNNNAPFIDLTPIKEDEKAYVKRINQIDKFNKKYGLK